MLTMNQSPVVLSHPDSLSISRSIAGGGPTVAAPTVQLEPRALDVLKAMSAKLARTQGMSFKAITRLELYPAPRPTDRVNLQTLEELQSYMTDNARSVLGQKYRIVPTAQSAPPGSRTLILRAAITGVTASNEGMHWYEVIPVAAVIGGVTAATGHRDQDTELYIEAEIIDASNGQTVTKVVRKVFGETLRNASRPITTNDFKMAIRALTSDLQAFIR